MYVDGGNGGRRGDEFSFVSSGLSLHAQCSGDAQMTVGRRFESYVPVYDDVQQCPTAAPGFPLLPSSCQSWLMPSASKQHLSGFSPFHPLTRSTPSPDGHQMTYRIITKITSSRTRDRATAARWWGPRWPSSGPSLHPCSRSDGSITGGRGNQGDKQHVFFHRLP